MKKYYVQKSMVMEGTWEVVEVNINGRETVICEMIRTEEFAYEHMEEEIVNQRNEINRLNKIKARKYDELEDYFNKLDNNSFYSVSDLLDFVASVNKDLINLELMLNKL